MTPEFSVLSRPQVLLVEPDELERDRLGAFLDEAGYEPINCPGPHQPGYSCLGVEGLGCALPDAASLVVLDAQTLPGIGSAGAAAWRLLHYYLAAGKPVVVIAENYRIDHAFRPEQIFPLHSLPSPESFLLAIRQLQLRARAWTSPQTDEAIAQVPRTR